MEIPKVLRVSNKTSSNVYPGNSPSDFRVALDPAFKFDGPWEVGLYEFRYVESEDRNDLEFGIVCIENLCKFQTIGERAYSILEIVPLTTHRHIQYYPIYKPIEPGVRNNLHIQIMDSSGKTIPFLGSSQVLLTLLFRRAQRPVNLLK